MTYIHVEHVEIVQIPGSTTADHSLSVKQFFFLYTNKYISLQHSILSLQLKLWHVHFGRPITTSFVYKVQQHVVQLVWVV